MKRLSLVSLLVMCIAGWAQTPSSSSSTKSSSTTQSSSTKSGAAANDTSEHTMTGCLVARNGEFFLQARGHRRPIELMSSDDLTAHNKHEVTVTGTWANKETVAEHEKNEEQNQSSAQKNANANAEKGERHFQVSKLEMVADHCGAANKTSAATGSSSAGTAPK